MNPAERLKMEEEVTKMLMDAGALLKGHFIGASWRHLDTYVNKNALTVDPTVVSKLGSYMADLFHAMNVEVVVGPSAGAVSLAHETARHLSERYKKTVQVVFTEKEDVVNPETGVVEKKHVFKRDFDKLVSGKRVLAVEDIITTGKSLKEVVALIQKAGGNLLGATAIVNRERDNNTASSFGIPMLDTLLSMNLKSWGEDEVPDWLRAIPIDTTIGHGKEYKKRHPDAK